MDILESLTSDHRLIAGVLDAFERFVTSAEQSAKLDLLELSRFCVFFREFVELSHHEREEHVLLPAMEELGYAADAAPLTHIRDEHRRERALLFELRRTSVRSGPPAAVERARILNTARDMIAFERAHMKKESELLYPSVKKELSGRTLEDLGRRVAERDSRLIVEQAWLRSLADELIRDHSFANREASVTPSGS
jgi:hemerythrin-like domain-containing protein